MRDDSDREGSGTMMGRYLSIKLATCIIEGKEATGISILMKAVLAVPEFEPRNIRLASRLLTTVVTVTRRPPYKLWG